MRNLLKSTATAGLLGLAALTAQISPTSAADMTTVIAACFAIVLLFVAGERLLLDPLARRFATR